MRARRRKRNSLYGANDHHQAEAEGAEDILDELHLRKIDLANRVMICNYDGYIGERTRIELEYARSRGKFIGSLEPLED